jgi:hypothetical protein
MLLLSRGFRRPSYALAAMRFKIAATTFGPNAYTDGIAMSSSCSIAPHRRRWSHATGKEGFQRPVSASSMPGPGPASAIALQQTGVQLPERCCGCGIRLQMSSPEAPGYFIVPAKLLEIVVGYETAMNYRFQIQSHGDNFQAVCY